MTGLGRELTRTGSLAAGSFRCNDAIQPLMLYREVEGLGRFARSAPFYSVQQ